MKALFDQVSMECSRNTTKRYSTSFSMATSLLDKRFRDPIYGVYGFVRFADEIVDTFHGFDKSNLLQKFWDDTHEAIEYRISLNPILNSFQQVYHEFNFDMDLVDSFMESMAMDLDDVEYDQQKFETYIYGSAEVVGLMCLKVFTENNDSLYQELKPYARSLGSAFQKVNFLRDLQADFENLGRNYFPGVDFTNFTIAEKKKIEVDIQKEFDHARIGIQKLPKAARFGVYLASIYYLRLFKKICNTSPQKIKEERVRISNPRKYSIVLSSYVRHQMDWV
ncbi:MAG: squalene/phytoene synthase family protein [Flavobacteriales bacterium]|nr:squalene/phytoene synthase family protein [Flavobacteriales bacterium]